VCQDHWDEFAELATNDAEKGTAQPGGIGFAGALVDAAVIP
jgi:hypothetical protein